MDSRRSKEHSLGMNELQRQMTQKTFKDKTKIIPRKTKHRGSSDPGSIKVDKVD